MPLRISNDNKTKAETKQSVAEKEHIEYNQFGKCTGFLLLKQTLKTVNLERKKCLLTHDFEVLVHDPLASYFGPGIA